MLSEKRKVENNSYATFYRRGQDHVDIHMHAYFKNELNIIEKYKCIKVKKMAMYRGSEGT